MPNDNVNVDWFIKTICDILYEVFDPEEKNDDKVDAAYDRIKGTVVAVLKDPQMQKDLLEFYDDETGPGGTKAATDF